jgi:hypothetical protein
MARTLRRSPRHLDAPIRIFGLTPGQCLLLLLVPLALWACLRLGVLPLQWRLSAALFLGVLPLALSFSAAGARALLDGPRRAWHTATTPRERVPGPPRRGPLRFALYDGQVAEEDLPDA